MAANKLAWQVIQAILALPNKAAEDKQTIAHKKSQAKVLLAYLWLIASI